MVSIITARFDIVIPERFTHTRYICLVQIIITNKAIICLYDIHRLVFLIEVHSVLCEVRTECYTMYISCVEKNKQFVKGSIQNMHRTL